MAGGHIWTQRETKFKFILYFQFYNKKPIQFRRLWYQLFEGCRWTIEEGFLTGQEFRSGFG